MPQANFRIWRGDQTGGQFQDYHAEIGEGMEFQEQIVFGFVLGVVGMRTGWRRVKIFGTVILPDVREIRIRRVVEDLVGEFD